ncbi:MAG: hypothetical protein ABI863_04640 [Ginsengibacter sp.]
MKRLKIYICAYAFLLVSVTTLHGQPFPRFKVPAFYSRTVEKAHVDFADNAIQFFKELTVGNGFVFDTTSNMEDLNDALVTHWERLPGRHPGLKLSHFTEAQKIAMHELLRSCPSTQGYLTATAVCGCIS